MVRIARRTLLRYMSTVPADLYPIGDIAYRQTLPYFEGHKKILGIRFNDATPDYVIRCVGHGLNYYGRMSKDDLLTFHEITRHKDLTVSKIPRKDMTKDDLAVLLFVLRHRSSRHDMSLDQIDDAIERISTFRSPQRASDMGEAHQTIMNRMDGGSFKVFGVPFWADAYRRKAMYKAVAEVHQRTNTMRKLRGSFAGRRKTDLNFVELALVLYIKHHKLVR